MSDEAKKKAKEYCDRYRDHSIDSLIYTIRPEPISFAENIYIAGYIQGRADALKELDEERRRAFEAARSAFYPEMEWEFKTYDDYKKEQEK